MTRPLGTLLAASMLCVPCASAQVEFTFVKTENFDLLSDDPSGADAFWIGNNPSAIAFDGNALYIGGFLNGANPGVWSVSVVQVLNILGDREFQVMEDTRIPVGDIPNGRGYTGMDYHPELGLIMTVDKGSFGLTDQVQTWDVDSQVTPFQVAASGAGGNRGFSGPSWDLGPDGQGFDLDGDGSNELGAAGVNDWAFFAFGDTNQGPFGMPVDDLDPFTAPISIANGNTPVIGTLDVPGLLWRDMDIDPNTGDMAFRVSNDLLIVKRASDNSVSSFAWVDEAEGIQNGQNCAILHGLCGGDLVIYNERQTSSTQAFTSSIKLVDLDGNPAAASFVDGAGDPVALPDGVGYYDFAWSEELGILFICDFQTRNVYIFSTGQDADLNGDGDTNVLDFIFLQTAFQNGDPAADVNNDGELNIFDFIDYQAIFSSGGCG